MRKLRSKISMSLVVFFVIVLCGISSCVLISVFLIRYNQKHMLDEIENNVRETVGFLSYDIKNSGYFNEYSKSVEDELNAISVSYDGRLVVTDSQLYVTYDSYYSLHEYDDPENRGPKRYLLIPEVSKALKGERTFLISMERETAAAYLPVSVPDTNKVLGTFYLEFPIHNEIVRQKVVKNTCISVCALISVIVVIVAFLASLLLNKPFRKLNRQLVSIKNGNRNDRLSVYSHRQVSEITESVNQILDSAGEMERNHQDFVSNVSHELKTPMTSIKVLAESLLMYNEDLPEMVREFLQDINTEIDRENNIISDLLTLVRMDRNANTATFTKCHINAIMDVILKRVFPIAEQKQVEVVCESYRDVYAEVDEPKLLMALTNIVENAIKYNRPGGNVHVTLNANMNYFFVTVRDTGFGIAEKEISHIFERFYRVDKDRSREAGGTGLGLSICKEIINLHNGQIKVYSKEDEGTTFTVKIPLIRQNEA